MNASIPENITKGLLGTRTLLVVPRAYAQYQAFRATLAKSQDIRFIRQHSFISGRYLYNMVPVIEAHQTRGAAPRGSLVVYLAGCGEARNYFEIVDEVNRVGFSHETIRDDWTFPNILDTYFDN